MAIKEILLWLAALMTSGLGVACLYLSWKGLSAVSKRITRIVALVFLYLSFYIFKELVGWEFALVFVAIIPVLFAWVLTFANRQIKNNKKITNKVPAIDNKTGWLTRVKDIWRFIVAIPLALIISVLLCTVLAFYLPMGEINRVILATFLLPILWGGLCSWVLADGQFKRSGLTLLILGMASFTTLYLM